ncbi:MAG: hypothetical protein WC758_04655 [Candidatus Woesearchaeota archaeon]|jgi:hypothetical protein
MNMLKRVNDRVMKPEDLFEKITFGYNLKYFFHSNNDFNIDNSKFDNIVDSLQSLTNIHRKKLRNLDWFTNSKVEESILYLQASGNFKELNDFLGDYIYFEPPGYETKLPNYIKSPKCSLDKEINLRVIGVPKKEGFVIDKFSALNIETTNFAFDYAKKLFYSRGFIFTECTSQNLYDISRSASAYKMLDFYRGNV